VIEVSTVLCYDGDSSLISIIMEGTSVNDNQTNEQESKKKISLQEAMKQQLANKTQQGQGGKASLSGNQKMQKMKSQLTKKPNNQRKRMGV